MLKPEILLNWDVFDSKLPEDPRGIGFRSPDPRGMKKCNPQFPESPRNENRQGIGIPNSNLI